MVKCKYEGCSVKRAIYGYDTPKYCLKHKEPNMKNIVDKKCFCGKVIASFGWEGEKTTHCNECKMPGMINIKNKNKKCFCGKVRPSFGLENNNATHCKDCKTPEMSDVISKKCFCGKHQPIFGVIGQLPTHCNECKTSIMIDLERCAF